MDDFNGEVSCNEVLGIEPSEQALTHGYIVVVAGRAGTHFFPREAMCVSLWSVFVTYTPAVLLCNSPQVDSSRVSLLAATGDN